VVDILNEETIKLDTGLVVKFLGIKILPEKIEDAKKYLKEYVKGKEVYLKFDPSFTPQGDKVPAYVFLKNKIFINKEMIKQGFATIQDYNFQYRKKFIKMLKGC
jgi:endonuclease YncB( thermonuclease family)